MTNEQILKKAIEKAIKNGYKPKSYFNVSVLSIDGEPIGIIEKIIFSHDFAKAFWGKEREVIYYKYIMDGAYSDDISVEEYNEIPENEKEKSWYYYIPIYKYSGWQYNLQQMVLEEEPIKYLEKFL